MRDYEIDSEVLSLFEPKNGGIVEIVENLLVYLPNQNLKIDFFEGHGRMTSLADPNAETHRKGEVRASRKSVFHFPMSKPIMRALIARVAFLCESLGFHSGTPYRGEGELISEYGCHNRIYYANTPQEQWLFLERNDHTFFAELESLKRSSAEKKQVVSHENA